MLNACILRSGATSAEIEPQICYRGHTAAVTSLAVSSARRRIFSASLDSTIRVWSYPPSAVSHTTYSPYDPSLTLSALIAHTDAIWDVKLIPSKTSPDGYLVSASADGTVKVWDADGEGPDVPLLGSWGAEGAGEVQEGEKVVPVSIAAYQLDLGKVLVGYTDGSIRLFELGSGRLVSKFDAVGPGELVVVDLQGVRSSTDVDHHLVVDGPKSAVNQIVCHPIMPIVISGQADGSIHFFDAKTGTPARPLPLSLSQLTPNPQHRALHPNHYRPLLNHQRPLPRPHLFLPARHGRGRLFHPDLGHRVKNVSPGVDAA